MNKINSPETQNAVGHLRLDLESTERRFNHLINATPTGEGRNALCDANIHIKAASDLLEKIQLGEVK